MISITVSSARRENATKKCGLHEPRELSPLSKLADRGFAASQLHLDDLPPPVSHREGVGEPLQFQLGHVGDLDVPKALEAAGAIHAVAAEGIPTRAILDDGKYRHGMAARDQRSSYP